MRIIRDHTSIAPEDRGASVAIGNFDGVHLGHRAVIRMAEAGANGAPYGVLTFEPPGWKSSAWTTFTSCALTPRLRR